MPYIPQDQREYPGNFSVGYLNYAITKLCLEYLDAWGESYTRHNDVLKYYVGMPFCTINGGL